jgi:hypothetical protein
LRYLKVLLHFEQNSKQYFSGDKSSAIKDVIKAVIKAAIEVFSDSHCINFLKKVN